MRTSAFAFLCSLFVTLAMWGLAALGAANLRTAVGPLTQIVLLLVAAALGLAAGWAIGEHRDRPHPVLFGATAGALCGALCGAGYALVMGIAYVATYGGTPVSLLDAILVLLAYPVFACLGALVAVLPGSLLGALAGYISTRIERRRTSEWLPT